MSTATYSEKLLDPRWQQLRLKVFERDQWTCLSCGATDKTLHAHHTVYHPKSSGPWDYDEETIKTLCCDCHSGEHETLKSAQANLLLALARRGYWSAYHLDCLVDVLDTGGEL